jgi:hypothetical protein
MAQSIRLKVIHDYRCGALYYESGSVIDVPADTGAWLQRDAPEAFVPYKEPEEKAPEAPPMDKMMNRAPRRKQGR